MFCEAAVGALAARVQRHRRRAGYVVRGIDRAAFVADYESWQHAAEPDQGYDAKAAEWREKFARNGEQEEQSTPSEAVSSRLPSDSDLGVRGQSNRGGASWNRLPRCG
jgi:hypothetical protein